MNRRFAALFFAIAVAAAIARPASALDPLPPLDAVVSLQLVKPTLAPLALCQIDVLTGKYRTLLAGIEGGATVPAVIAFMGLPSDPGVHDLALLTLAAATHEMDKQHPERRGTCAGLAPTVVPTPDVYAISMANLKFADKRTAIQAYLTPSMAARLAKLATSMQRDGSLTSSVTVLAWVKSQLGDVQCSAGQLGLLEYVAIQGGLDGRLALVRVSAAVAALPIRKSLPMPMH